MTVVTTELEAARAFLEIAIGQHLDENPRAGGDHKSDEFRSKPHAV